MEHADARQSIPPSSTPQAPEHAEPDDPQIKHIYVRLLDNFDANDVSPAPLAGVDGGSMGRLRAEHVAEVESDLSASRMHAPHVMPHKLHIGRRSKTVSIELIKNAA